MNDKVSCEPYDDPQRIERLAIQYRTNEIKTCQTSLVESLLAHGNLPGWTLKDVYNLYEESGNKMEHREPKMRKIFEWWLVSSWLGSGIRYIGEPLLENDHGNWWGRTKTGQGFLLDGTLQEIARRRMSVIIQKQ